MAAHACRRPESSRNATPWRAEGVGPASPGDRVFPDDKGGLASKETLDGDGASQSLALPTPCRRGTWSSGCPHRGNPIRTSERGGGSAGSGRRPVRPGRGGDGQEVVNELMLVLSLEN